MNFLSENNFFDPDFLMAELPDSLFQTFGNRFCEQPLVFVLETPSIVGGVQTSVLASIDYDGSQICVGPRDQTPYRYEIVPDYDVVDCVSSFVEMLESDNVVTFPVVPVSEPKIPPNKVYKRKILEYERVMFRAGFSLADPTRTQVDMLGDCGRFVAARRRFTHEVLFEDVEDSALVFFSFRDFNDDLHGRFRCVGMQFNPYHPLSINFIKSMDTVGSVVSGQYEYYGKMYSFSFDINDRRYRVHSDQWMPNMGLYDDKYYCFDIVGNFDFLDLFEFKPVKTFIEPIFIEPLISNRRPCSCYSIIGPWDGEVRFGVGPSLGWPTFVPYITDTINVVSDKASDFGDVSSWCWFEDGDTYLYYDFSSCPFYDLFDKYYHKRYRDASEVYVIPKKKKKIPVSGRILLTKDYCDEFFFIRYRTIGDPLVYVPVIRPFPGSLSFLFFGARVLTCPTTRHGSIVLDYKCVTIIDALRMAEPNATLRELIPLGLIPRSPPDYGFNMQMDVESLINETDYSLLNFELL